MAQTGTPKDLSKKAKAAARNPKYDKYRLSRYLPNKIKRIERHLRRHPGDLPNVRLLESLKGGIGG